MLSNIGFTKIEFSPTLSTNAQNRDDQERASMERRLNLKVTWSLVEDIPITLSERSKMVCSTAKTNFQMFGSFDWGWITGLCQSYTFLFECKNCFSLGFWSCLQIWYSHVQSVQLSYNEVETLWCRSKACQGTYWLSERVRPSGCGGS